MFFPLHAHKPRRSHHFSHPYRRVEREAPHLTRLTVRLRHAPDALHRGTIANVQREDVKLELVQLEPPARSQTLHRLLEEPQPVFDAAGEHSAVDQVESFPSVERDCIPVTVYLVRIQRHVLRRWQQDRTRADADDLRRRELGSQTRMPTSSCQH